MTPELLVENTKYLNEFICLFCTNIVDSTIECEKCEKIFCEISINKYTIQRKNECPNCRKSPFESRKLNRIIKDFLGNLKFKCPLNCGEFFDYSNKEKHISLCKNIKIINKCNLCSIILPMQLNIKENHKLKCEKLQTNCPYCKEPLIKFKYESHILTCPKSLIHCEDCKINVSPQFQDAHKNFFCNHIKNILNSVSILILKLQQL